MVAAFERIRARRAAFADPRDGESGQAIVEGVVGTLLVSTCFALILMCIIGFFSINAVNAAIQAASWDISPSASQLAPATSQADKDAYVRSQIADRVSGLANANLSVSGTNVTSRTDTVHEDVTRNATRLGLSSLDTERDFSTISFDVSYKVPGFNVTITRHVSHALSTRTQSEVS